jgi:hypothetical protein
VYAAIDGAPGLHSLVVKQLHRQDQKRSLHERIVAGPRQLIVWADADPTHGDGVEIDYEEGRDL